MEGQRMIKNELGRLEMYPLPPVTKSKLVLIGEYPNVTELKEGKYFISTGADSLKTTLGRVHIDLDECYFTVAVPYLMNKKNKVIPVSRHDQERQRLIREIKESGASLVMPLGTLATSLLMNVKGMTITKVLGNVLDIPELPGVKIIPNYHPALLLHSPGNYKVFSNVIEVVGKFYHGQDVSAGTTVWKWVETEKDLKQLIQIVNGLEVVAADIETSSLVRHEAQIWTFGICTAKNQVSVVSAEAIEDYPELIKELLSTGAIWVWHGGKYDTSVWYWRGFLEARLDADTMLQHYCLNETNGSHGLGILATIYLGADEYKSKMNSEFAAIIDYPTYEKKKQDLGERVAVDADYTYQLYHIFRDKVASDEDLQKLYDKILIPAAAFLVRTERNGMKVDVKYLKDRIPVYDTLIEQALEEIQEAAAPYWSLEDYKEDTGAKSGSNLFKPTSVKQLAWLIYDKLKLKPAHKDAKKRGTGEEVLESINNPPEFIQRILDLRKIKKEYTTYVLNYIAMRDENDLVHTNFNLHITTTGRLSSTEPNVQNVPSSKPDVRRAFIARKKNRILMEVDYSGAELRVLAYISGDKNLARALTEGDPHGELAEKIFGDGYTLAPAGDRKNMRNNAKTVNFGIAYGRQAPNLSRTFNISLAEAQSYIDAWAELYPQAWEYLQGCEADVRSGKTLRTLYGRCRRFGLIHQANIQDLINEGKNFRIQSISSDNTLLAAMEMEPVLRDQYDTLIINLIHDSILLDVPADPAIVKAVAKFATTTMIELPVKMYGCLVPFKSDVDLGPTWGDYAAYDIDTETVNYKDTVYPYTEWITKYGIDCSGREV